jgi:hypothetical protein
VRSCVAIVAFVACGKSAPPEGREEPAPVSEPAATAATTARPTCEPLPFASETPVPEASGAAWLDVDGRLALVVVGDSGHRGAYGILDPETGETREQGRLPLGAGSDDLEGVAGRDGKLYGISSAGWIRVWVRQGTGFALVDGPYPLGPVDLPVKAKGVGDQPPEGDGMVCPVEGTNCGRNYEGLCLAPRPSSGVNPLLCTGFAASKADGHLYCLTELNEPHDLQVDRARAIRIDRPGVIADCAFGDDGRLWVGNNLFGAMRVVEVIGWHDPATAKLVELGALGVGFPEAIAARGDVIYRLSDTGGAPSMMTKFRCGPISR